MLIRSDRTGGEVGRYPGGAQPSVGGWSDQCTRIPAPPPTPQRQTANCVHDEQHRGSGPAGRADRLSAVILPSSRERPLPLGMLAVRGPVGVGRQCRWPAATGVGPCCQHRLHRVGRIGSHRRDVHLAKRRPGEHAGGHRQADDTHPGDGGEDARFCASRGRWVRRPASRQKNAVGERPRRAKRHACPTASRRYRRPRSAGAGPVLDSGARLKGPSSGWPWR